jgi:uncharacterized protein YfaS (alpha-2-macroglobulin family)
MNSIKMVVLALLLVLFASAAFGGISEHEELRQAAQKAYRDGNWKDAYELFNKLCLEVDNNAKGVGKDLIQAWSCLQNLNRLDELDVFREKVIKKHGLNWRLLLAAARSYSQNNHWGYRVAGRFHRGSHRGGGQYVNAIQRDRVRALQLMKKALELSSQDPARSEVAQLNLKFARMLLQYRGYNQAWRLQYLTDLSKLPDYEPGYGYEYNTGTKGAPVDENGNPVFHRLPKRFEAAKSDGERWRWLLKNAVKIDSNLTSQMKYTFASFLHQQFGVQTMASYGRYFPWGRPAAKEELEKNESGPYAVHTLKDSETIAKLASGVKRFELPDEFNYIKLYQEIIDLPGNGYAGNTTRALAQIYENRRLYDRAVSYWELHKEYHKSLARKRIDQILNNWGVFESIGTQPADRTPSVEYRYRNGNRVEFEAYRIKVSKLLQDVKAYILSNPRRLEWRKVNFNHIGWRLVHANEKKYIGQKTAAWGLDLEPDERHWDRHLTINTSAALKKAGAYLLLAKMNNGNTARIIIWVSDTAIVKKPLKRQVLYYVADAVSGQPLAGADIEFFGYRQENIGGTKWYTIHSKSFVRQTDENGQVILDPDEMNHKLSWLATVTAKSGRLAFLGFSGIWYPNYYDYQYNQTKTFIMTDRPVYRPAQKVRFKAWVRHAKYDKENVSSHAGQHFTITVRNPNNQQIYSKTIKADAYGGLEGEFDLPLGANLGVYSISHGSGVTYGGNTFRVEEYKKPEFEVAVEAPSEPVMLGEKITATIKARYYFGSPVTDAKVSYKIIRAEHDSRWYPQYYWDWFYGPGYWWYGYDYPWYPGWQHWGCKRPIWVWWQNWSRQQPEIVAEGEVKIGRNGTVKIEIDTELAKLIHGDKDHRYTINAEVRDQSRRVIVGQGDVLVARRPFKVYTWVDRGHYRVGDTVQAGFQAQTLDQKPVEGKGQLRLLRLSYDNGKPVESEVQKWALDTNAQGQTNIQIQATRAGQYRLSYSVTDNKNHSIEGGYLFNVRGAGDDGAQYRFAKIELVQDQSEYTPGETVRLLINTDRKGAAVVLFVRPSNGIYLPPKVIHITGKSAVEKIKVSKKDMPNFFVEAFTVYDGKVHSEIREIIVPPEKRVLNIKVTPSKKDYRPGDKAKLKLKLADYYGQPFQGSAVITVYDRSVEYISGGSNVPEIKAFFWQWRRSHHRQTESSLARWFHNLLKKNETPMRSIGAFGHLAEQGLQQKGVLAPAGEVVSETETAEPSEMPAASAKPSVAREIASKEKKDIGGRYNSKARLEGRSQLKKIADEKGVGIDNLVEPAVRSKFADTAFWAGSVSTDEQGHAEVQFSMPENLTGWQVKVWAMGHGTKVGEGSVEVVTRKNLILRLQAPRFFVEKDEVVLSANVHNYLNRKKSVRLQLEFDGGCLALLQTEKAQKVVTIDSNSEKRIDWRVKVLKEGEAVVRMKALTDEESDAMQMHFPVYVHGLMKQIPKSGVIRPDQSEMAVTFKVPAERRIDQSRLELRYSPTLAGAMVDALPYLTSYPYGCTEQTLNRFLPTVITQRTLKTMGLDLVKIRDKRTNLNAQEIGDDRQRSQQWKRYDHNPVFDEKTVEDMVKKGIQRLANMQLSDGGWGWFSGYGEQSWPHTTAYVIHGLQIARASDVKIPVNMIRRGVQWLQDYQAEELSQLKRWDRYKRDGKPTADNLDAFIYMVLVDENLDNKEMRAYLYRDRNGLAVYAKAMFAMALHKTDDQEKLIMLLQNIEQYLVQDDENQTAYLNLPNTSYWWYWYGSDYEAHGYYLKLLSRTEPGSRKSARLVKYLLNNRKHATYWKSTRDTAVIVEAFAEYLAASGEDKPDLALSIYLDGKKMKTVAINKDNLFTFDNKFILEGNAVATGKHTLQLKKSGHGPVYFNAYLDIFTLEDFITREGLEIKVQRKIYRLIKVDKKIKDVGSRGQAVDRKVEKYIREELQNLASLKSGEKVEVELVIDSKNDYEYIVIEDMKAAGLEPLEVRSGYNGNEMRAYVEFRDEKVCFFVQRLARGRHSLSYRLRAEVPGKFSALPTRAYGMYAPELKANSDEIKLIVTDD